MRTRMIALAAALAAGCDGGEEGAVNAQREPAAPTVQQAASRTIGDDLADSPDHSRFMEAVGEARLAETLRGEGPYTLFVPVNSAMEDASLPEGDELTGRIAGHISPGAVTREDLLNAVRRNEAGRAELATLDGGTISIAIDGGDLVLTDGAGAQARIVEADGIRSNGVVHSIDAVLEPSAR